MKENYINKARELYPIGTIFKSAQSGLYYKVDSNIMSIDHNGNLRLYMNNGDSPHIVFRDRWAEIVSISEPKDKIIDNYEIY